MVGDLYRDQTMIVVVVIEQDTPIDFTEPPWCKRPLATL